MACYVNKSSRSNTMYSKLAPRTKIENSTQNNFNQRSPKRIRIEKPSTLIAFPPVISAPDNIENWRMGYKICHVAFQLKSFPLHIL